MTVARARIAAGIWAVAFATACTSSPASRPAAAPVPAPASVAAPAAALPTPAQPPTAPVPAETVAPSQVPPVPAQPLPEGTQAASKAPRLGQDELRARFSAFPKAVSPIVSMGQQMIAHQTPMTLAYFDTRADALEVLEFYAAEFDKRGWSWTGLEDNHNVIDHPGISATDPEDDMQMSVVVIGNGRGEPRTVILGLVDVRPEARVPDEGDLPAYPGTRPIVLRSSELGTHAYSQTLVTPDPPGKVTAFYLERLPELGYQQLSSGEEGSDLAPQLVFGKRDRIWRIRVSKQQNETMVLAIGTTIAEEDRP